MPLTKALETVRKEDPDFRHRPMIDALVAGQAELDGMRRSNAPVERVEARRAQLLRDAEAVVAKERDSALMFARARVSTIVRSYQRVKSRDEMTRDLFDRAALVDLLTLSGTKALLARANASGGTTRREAATLVRELRARGEDTAADKLMAMYPVGEGDPWESDPEWIAAEAALEGTEARTRDTRLLRVATVEGKELEFRLDDLLL